MTYDERKAQLNQAMLRALDSVGGHIGFLVGEEPVLDLIYWGESQKERLMDIYLQEHYSDGDERLEDTVTVHTIINGFDDTYTDFTEFCNAEMEKIMEAVGIQVPEEVREEVVTENLALGLLHTDKPLVYGVLNTANYDVMGYTFVAMDDSTGLANIGCSPEDCVAADMLPVGGVYSSLEWPAENAILIVKMKDDRDGSEKV